MLLTISTIYCVVLQSQRPARIEDFEMGDEFWPGRRQRNVAKAWKRGVFGLHAGQCVCELKINKLIGRTSHCLCTFSTSIREIKYYFNI